eukprot:symbB.v1.2.022806.t1/scaffold2064.1/size90802/4
MDELHGEQMQRIDEIEEELDLAMADLKKYIQEFMQKFRKELDDTFTALFSELQEQVELITPRIAAIEARGRVLRNGIDEEKQDRIRHYAEILVPVKAQIAKLEEGLSREEKIRQVCGGGVPLVRACGFREDNGYSVGQMDFSCMF